MVFYLKSILNYFDLNARIDKVHEVDNSDSINNIKFRFLGMSEPIELNKKISDYNAYKINHVDQQIIVNENILSKILSKIFKICGIKGNENVNHIPLWEQILMYVGTFIGVFFSSMVMQFNSNKIEIFDLFNLTSLIFSAIVTLVIIPNVFEKLKVEANTPLLVRFGLFVQNGVFWQFSLNIIIETYQII